MSLEQSNKMRETWANYTAEEREARIRGNSATNWDLLSVSEREGRVENSITNLRKSWEMDEETRKLRDQRAGESISRCWKSLTTEEKEGWLRSSFLSPEAILRSGEGRSNYWSSITPEEKESRLLNSIHSKEARDKAVETLRDMGETIGESVSQYWASLSKLDRVNFSRKVKEGQRLFFDSLTPEKSAERMRNSLLSDEAILRSRQSNSTSPNFPETLFGFWLDENFPNEWKYNGDGSQKVIIGRKIPDFVNVDGKKGVIEIFGTYWHDELEVGEKIEHYNRFGYNCLVLWDYECYLWKELKDKFSCWVKELTT